MPLSTVLGAQSLIKPGVCTTATRPASPYEGQMIYDTDVATTLVWDGTAWVASGGKVLQVVSGTTSAQATSSSTTYADTNLTATITPTSASSKVLVVVTQNGLLKSAGAVGSGVQLKLLRGVTDIQRFGAEIGYTGTTLTTTPASCSTQFLDSPTTTSATTYKTQFANTVAASLVRVQDGSVTASTIILMEISA